MFTFQFLNDKIDPNTNTKQNIDSLVFMMLCAMNDYMYNIKYTIQK